MTYYYTIGIIPVVHSEITTTANNDWSWYFSAQQTRPERKGEEMAITIEIASNETEPIDGENCNYRVVMGHEVVSAGTIKVQRHHDAWVR